jgi:PAS domain S-box-containing protein
MTSADHPRKRKASPSAPDVLRRQAEERVESLPAAAAAASLAPDDNAVVLHELLVHQIELEMQNEELRRAQLELDEQREKYFELFDMAPVGYFTLSDKGIVGDANLTAAHLLGVSRSMIIGQPFSAFVFAADRDSFYLHERVIWKTEVPQTSTLRLHRFQADTNVGAPPEPFWARVNGRLRQGSNDKPALVWVTFTDISETAEAAEALRDSEERLDLALRSAGMGTWHFNIIEDKRVFDERACSLLGIDPVTFTGAAADFFGVLHPDDAPKVKAALALTIENDAPYAPDYRVVHPDGTVRWIAGRGRLVRDAQGRPWRINGVISDITEHKRAEEEVLRLNADLERRVRERTEQLAAKNRALNSMNIELEEATRAKSEFLAAMSHELRTPLNSIIGFSGVLSQELAGSLNDEQQRQIGMINNSGRHLLELVNEILDLAKIESGQKRPKPQDADVGSLVRDAFDTVKPIADAKGAEMRLICPEHVEPLQTDALYINQILLNLLGNAVKFSEEGLITTTVSQDRSGVTICVKDTGCGISAADMEHVFDDFFQATPRAGGKSDGTGLGLAVSRRLAESIGARIEIISELGQGSTFTLVIPDGQQ